jgi:hypothetical protein
MSKATELRQERSSLCGMNEVIAGNDMPEWHRLDAVQDGLRIKICVWKLAERARFDFCTFSQVSMDTISPPYFAEFKRVIYELGLLLQFL